jgi:hypothetical protein
MIPAITPEVEQFIGRLVSGLDPAAWRQLPEAERKGWKLRARVILRAERRFYEAKAMESAGKPRDHKATNGASTQSQ